MIYSAWGRDDGDGYEFLFIPGHELPPEHAGQSPGLTLLKVFEADSWDDAARQYYEWQGWEPYKPMGDSPADHQP